MNQNITAFIYDKRGRLLSMGKNSYVKTHPMQAKLAKQAGLEDKQFLHAEIHAISRCSQLEKAHRIVVLRFNNAGEPRLAKPCKICQSAIDMTNIKVIEHS